MGVDQPQPEPAGGRWHSVCAADRRTCQPDRPRQEPSSIHPPILGQWEQKFSAARPKNSAARPKKFRCFRIGEFGLNFMENKQLRTLIRSAHGRNLYFPLHFPLEQGTLAQR
jgi:hypothetical protein